MSKQAVQQWQVWTPQVANLCGELRALRDKRSAERFGRLAGFRQKYRQRVPILVVRQVLANQLVDEEILCGERGPGVLCILHYRKDLTPQRGTQFAERAALLQARTQCILEFRDAHGANVHTLTQSHC